MKEEIRMLRYVPIVVVVLMASTLGQSRPKFEPVPKALQSLGLPDVMKRCGMFASTDSLMPNAAKNLPVVLHWQAPATGTSVALRFVYKTDVSQYRLASGRATGQLACLWKD